MSRSIVHMDLDTFFVSCVRLENPKLQGIPLIVGGGERGVVASCSHEARYFGVRSAMPIRMAMQLCPQAKIVKGDMELFSKKSHEVTQIIEEHSPLVEKASIDEFYLDITGLDKFYGCYQWTTELIHTITKETGLPISFALSVNKTVSKIATGEGKPNGNLEIPQNKVEIEDPVVTEPVAKSKSASRILDITQGLWPGIINWLSVDGDDFKEN